MNYLPAIPVTSIAAVRGGGGIAVNVDGTLIASVVRLQHCVHIYSVVDATVHPVVIGTSGIAGSAPGQLDHPAFTCFVHRCGIETLLICDYGNNRVVEVTGAGVFLRAITMEDRPFGIAYCRTSDVIAVSLWSAHAVVLLQYESGAVKPEFTIGSTRASDDGQLRYPRSVSFTADGRYILVVDWFNHRVSKFSAASGAFIAHVATKAANGIWWPKDAVQCEDGSVVVTESGADSRGGVDGRGASVVCVGQDGGTIQRIPNIIIPCACETLSYSPSLKGILLKTSDGSVFLLRDAWMYSSR
jgi:DNA-binding beta-propeller fold protein YncE